MNVNNVKSQIRRGMLEYYVLLLLEKRSAYMPDIIQRLKEAELLVVEGTLYLLLTRLKGSYLLDYKWQESTQGPPRRYYTFIEKGVVLLRKLDRAWGEIAVTVSYLKQLG